MGPSPTPANVFPVSVELRAFCARQMSASGAEEFEVSPQQLEQWLAEVAHKSGATSGAECTKFLESLKLPELVLARACALGNELAWEQFMTRFREPLFTSAYKIAGNESRGRELADSLYAELYGINPNGAQRKSKLLYYHGRGSLEGWLRTVLAQEYVDRFRKTRRETSLDEQVEAGQQFAAPTVTNGEAHDSRVDTATTEALVHLSAEDRFILASYFLDDRSLADVAKLLKVHESTISRRIQKSVGALKQSIEKHLVAGGMSARQAQEAMESADVRDINVNIHAALQQEKQKSPFYKSDIK
jgi:RNA polymerase sigma-70 factor (ECF subfamily)